MADALISNQITLRGCILYEFIEGKEPFITYQKLMKKLGDEFMTYPEFEFWFMRFARGNFDLSYDISLEPKKLQITDLPVEIFEKVGDSLYFEDRIKLRVASKDIQFRVDNWNPKLTYFAYDGFDSWYIEQSSKTYQYGRWKGANPLPVVLKMLKNPNLRLQELTVEQDAKWMKIEEELRKSSTKLHVIKFTLLNNIEYPIDFNLFSLKSLERVSVSIHEPAKRVHEFVNPEHCKQLKMFTISTGLSPYDFPDNCFFNYPRFTINFWGICNVKSVVEFIKNLVKSTQLELCILVPALLDLEVYSHWESFKRHLNEKDNLVPDSPNIRRFPIQGSTDFYEINIIEKGSISIERKS